MQADEVSQRDAHAKGENVPLSANRLSISYAAGTRRLLIDADIIDALKVFRSVGRIEVHLTIDRKADGFRGIQLEGMSSAMNIYSPLSVDEVALVDGTVPPLAKAGTPLKTVLVVYLDTDRPLSEPKWVKTGDVQEWLRSVFARVFYVAGETAVDGWERRIEVVDPDPAPTIWDALDGWATNSFIGLQTERRRFIQVHMADVGNILEILLRLVRGERATPFTQTAPAISAQSVSGPLLSALVPGSAYGARQTHVSLAVLAMFRMTVEYARMAGGDKAKNEVEERIGEIIRCLPSHLLYKSLDGIFKEWKTEKDGK